MATPFWELSPEEPLGLDCDVCFGVIEYHANQLAVGSADLLAKIVEHPQGCPDRENKHHEALCRLVTSRAGSSDGARQ